jgi:hypothetical protein
VHVRPVRPDGERPGSARCPAGRAAAAGHPWPGPAPLLPGATWLWAEIFLLLADLAVLMVTESAKMFLMLSVAATVALVVAGTGAFGLWFFSMLRRLGLRLRFAAA